ncbi:MAG TPA: YceI family protein [Euzebyales bacterium]|nr:YceI family protein [Euzebyales bacterium]
MTPTSSPRAAVDAGMPRTAGRYEIDAASTSIEIRTRCAGLPVGGTFDGVAGRIEVLNDLTRATVSVTVDPGSFAPTAGPLGALLRRGVEANAGPVTHFEADRMEPILESFVTHDGDRPLWALVGNLTLCGVTRPARIAVGVVRPLDGGATIAFSGTTTLRCAQFGVRRHGGLLSDTIRVRIRGVASRGC